MAVGNPQRRPGVYAVEDTRGTKTLIGFDSSNDKIVHINVNANGSMSVILDSWGRTEYVYDTDNDVTYRGVNKSATADGTESDWEVTKYTMDADKNVTIKQKLIGVWDNRTSLTWS